METTSLIHDLINTGTIHFRNIKVGDSLELVEQIEGAPTEIQEYSNPFYRYFFEIGEMEEITVYYNYNLEDRLVHTISLYLFHYPDHYWKKAGNTDPIEFWNLLNNNQLQPYSTVFSDTLKDVIAFFTKTLNEEPTSSSEKNGVFDEPYQNYKVFRWNVDEYNLSIQTYIDDSVYEQVKNTMIITISGSGAKQ